MISGQEPPNTGVGAGHRDFSRCRPAAPTPMIGSRWAANASTISNDGGECGADLGGHFLIF
jgi:hypothetical protein